jgi:hypothetical protein
MSKLVFSGCSFTAGTGWRDLAPEESVCIDVKDCSDLFVNLCAAQIPQLQPLEVVNYGQAGASNTEIFVNTIDAISSFQKQIKVIFCQWTSMPRYNFDLGFELWTTKEGFSPGLRSKNAVNLSDGTTWNRKYLDDLLDRLRVLHHMHPEIVKVVKYSNILQSIAKSFGIKLYFINGLCPWDQDYFIRLENVLPEYYTAFTKKEILNIEHRDDKDIYELYKIMHDQYHQAGGIDPSQWVNLYSSMKSTQLDTNYDNHHPGIKSNQLYFQQVKTFLENQQ